MGGLGSGARWSKKRRVESCDYIDTALLRRWGLLVPGVADRCGSLEWRRGGAAQPSSTVSYRLTVGADTGTLRLVYSIPALKEDFNYEVRLAATPCHLGGVRWWFICPLVKDGVACGRRVRKLHFCGKYFGCRRCHGLVYRSSQESDSRVYALARGGVNAVGDPGGKSVAQLGVMLRALDLLQKRLDRSAARF